MDLPDLRFFVTVARCRTLALASTELHQTASALSKALRRLEASVQTPLFDRSSKQLVLNRAGEALLLRALQLLHFAEQTRSELKGSDCRYTRTERLFLVQAPTQASGWQRWLVGEFAGPRSVGRNPVALS